MAAPNGLVVAWPSTAGSIPAGWSRVTAMDSRYPKASATMASTGGGNTHTHTPSAGHSHLGSSSQHGHVVTSDAVAPGTSKSGTPGTQITDQSHTHTVDIDAVSTDPNASAETPSASSSSNGEPNHYTVIWIQSNGTTDIAVGSVLYWYGSTAPNNHAICDGTGGNPDLRNYYLRGAAGGADGGTATPAAAHTHTYSHTHTFAAHSHALDSPSDPETTVGSDIADVTKNFYATPDTHVHGVTGSLASQSGLSTGSATGTTSDSATPDPPFIKVHHIRKTGASAELPSGIIALWISGAVPAGWQACDGTNGTVALNDIANPFLKGANGDGERGTVGGSSSHSHTIATHGHNAGGSHSHPGSSMTLANVTPSANNIDATAGPVDVMVNHTHSLASVGSDTMNVDAAGSVVLPTSAGNNEPAYYTVKFIQTMPVDIADSDNNTASVSETEAVSVGATDTDDNTVSIDETEVVSSLGVTVNEPTVDQLETTANVPVSWTLTGDTQQSYRVVVYADAAGTEIVWDSGTVISSDNAIVVPEGILDTDSEYWVQVDLHGVTAGSEVISDLIHFTTHWTTSVNISGLTIEAVGDLCDDTLPGFTLRWNQVVPGAGETFVRYLIRRREAGETQWTTIKTIDFILTTTYTDYNVRSYAVYEYSVIWAATAVAGALISADVIVRSRVRFQYSFVHSTVDPSYWLRLEFFEGSATPQIEVTHQRLWGRQAPTAFLSEAFSRSFSVSLLEGLRRDTRRWNMLQAMLQLSDTFCLRFGPDRERYFVSLTPGDWIFAQLTKGGDLSFQEVHHEEDVLQ